MPEGNAVARQQWLPRLAIAAAVLLFIDAGLDLAMATYPPMSGTPQWRFGAVGLLAGRSVVLVIGGTLLAWGFAGLSDRWAARAGGVLAFIASLGLGVLLVLFLLDALQISSTVLPERSRVYWLASVRAAVVLGGTAGLYAWFGVILLRAHTRGHGRLRSGTPLVVQAEPRAPSDS